MLTRPLRAPIAALLLLVVVTVASCGSDSDDTSTADETTTSSTVVDEGTPDDTTTSVGGETDTEPGTEPGTEPQDGTDSSSTTEDLEGTDTETTVFDSLPAGVHHAYLAGLEGGTIDGRRVQVIIVDEVELLTGDAATAAAKQDGVIPEDQLAIENDYYVRNEAQTVRRLAVAPDATVTSLEGGGPTVVPSSVDQVWRERNLFRLTVADVGGITTVSAIEAVYLP